MLAPSVYIFASLALTLVSAAQAPPSGAACGDVCDRTDAGEASTGSRGPEFEAAAPTQVPLLLLGPGGDDEQRPPRFDTLPLSLSIRVRGSTVHVLFPRGTPLPANTTRLFTTTVDSQPHARIELYVGERFVVAGNRCLASFELGPLPEHSHRSFVQLEVAVEVQSSGAVLCTVAELESKALGIAFAEAAWAGDVTEPAHSCMADGEGEGEIDIFSHSLAKHLPVLLATRTVRVGARDIVIRQHQRRTEERVGTGGALWESAIVLADFVHRHRGYFAWRGRRVLELGAGTGLVAIALALQGASAVATDGNPQVCRGAEGNVELNLPGGEEQRCSAAQCGSVRVVKFDWNSEPDLRYIVREGPWDLIVGSDLVYPMKSGNKCVTSNEVESFPGAALLRILTALASDHTEIVLALKNRAGELQQFIDHVDGQEWNISRAPGEAVMPDFRPVAALAPDVGGAIGVLHLRRSQPGGVSSGRPCPAQPDAASPCEDAPFHPIGKVRHARARRLEFHGPY